MERKYIILIVVVAVILDIIGVILAGVDIGLGVKFQSTSDEILGCHVPVGDDESGEEASLPVGIFAIINGLTFFYYIPCLLVFSACWTYCDEEGRRELTKQCFGEENTNTKEVAEKIGVGAAAILGILVSVGDLIAAGISENCGTPAANAFIALNVFVTLLNVSAAIQVSVVFFREKIFKSD